MTSNTTLDCGYASVNSTRQWLETVDHVDAIDLDIQGAENTLLPALMGDFSAKVYRLIVGTHSGGTHARMQGLLDKAGWMPVWNVPHQAYKKIACVERHFRGNHVTDRTVFNWTEVLRQGCYHRTPRGPVTQYDGELIYDNPRFVDRARLLSMAETEFLRVDDLIGT